MVRRILNQNILRQLRTSLGYTQSEMAEIVGISHKSVQNAETGIYATPLPSIAEFLAQRTNTTYADIEKKYAIFRNIIQTNTREHISPKVYTFTCKREDVNVIMYQGKFISPFQDFRINALGFTRQDFIYKLLVNPGTLSRLESGDFKSIPIDIRNALLACGAPTEFVDELNERTKRYKHR